MSASYGLAQPYSALGAEIARSDPLWPTVVTTAAVVASLQIGYLAGIGIRHFLIFTHTHTSLMRAASFAASQPARRWSDGEKARCFSAVRSDANGTFETSRDVRRSVAIRGKADVARTVHFGSD
jgi:hypothetical protein